MVPPLRARTCDPSTAQSSRSSSSVRRSSVSRAACRRGQTPGSVQSRSRRQAVTPEQPTVSAGRPARRHRSAARTGRRRVLFDQEHATARDAGGAARERAAATGHPLPQVVRNKISTHCRPRTPTRPAAQLILKRSVGAGEDTTPQHHRERQQQIRVGRPPRVGSVVRSHVPTMPARLPVGLERSCARHNRRHGD